MARRSHLILAASVWASAFAFGPSAMAAVDPAKLSQAITEMLEGSGLKFQAESTSADGDNVTLKGVTVTPRGEAATPAALGDITLNSVSETADGFSIGEISTPAKSYPVKDGSWEFGGASIKNLTIPAAGTTDPAKKMMLYEQVEVAPSTFKTSAGKAFITFAGAKVTMSKPDGNSLAFDMSAPDISFDFSAVPEQDPKMLETFQALDLMNTKMSIVAKGSWNMTDGRLIISEESFNVDKVGRLNFTADISGYTPQLMASMQDMVKASEGKSDAEMGAKMMGLMQQLSLGNVSLRFDDASIVSKALDLGAKAAGQSKEALIAQAKGMAPLMFMQLQDPEFSTAATKALGDFLDNPKNLEVKLAPAAPVPLSQIMASGMAAPATLVKQLGLTVVANQ